MRSIGLREECITETRVRHRTGKVLVIFAVILPVLFAVIAYYIDGSMMLLSSRSLQSAVDAAATAAAYDLMKGADTPAETAQAMVHEWNAYLDAVVTTNIPPTTGEFAGREGYVEVTVESIYKGFFVQAYGLSDPISIRTRAVAGMEAATDPAAVVILDPDPSPISLASIPVSLPSVHPLLGGLEVIGVGGLVVDGAIHVNNGWSGFDEDGNFVGEWQGLRSACSCTPILPLTRVRARDMRVVGGVDDPDNYEPFNDGAPSPLRANRLPVPDPLRHVPPPTLMSDPANVHTQERGGRTIVGLAPITPPSVLQPGVYDWIDVVGAEVRFDPGVYIIRGKHPLTSISLSLVNATVIADGVMFYITTSSEYSPSSGLPDVNDGDTSPPPPGVPSVIPSVLIANVAASSRFTPIVDSGSPYDGLLIFQRRWSRRPIAIVQHDLLGGLLGSTTFEGNVYAKWANLLLVGGGEYRSAFAVGSLRVVSALGVRISPVSHLSPAYDVYLTE
jgi:hypothetical protein